MEIPRGIWTLPERLSNPAAIYALVVIDGMLCRESSLRSGSQTELLIAGDVFSPAPSPDGVDDELITSSVMLSALGSVQVLVLAREFLKAGGIWPGLMLAVRHRVDAQQAHLATQGLALHFSRASDRILLTLWLLADRCGTVTPQGTALPFQIPHQALSRLTGARRPTVSLALAELRERDALQTTPDGRMVPTRQGQRDLVDMLSTFPGQGHPLVATSLNLPSPRRTMSLVPRRVIARL